MAKQFNIKSLKGINWSKHYDFENEIDFQDYFIEGQIEVGDLVTVENKKECVLPLRDNQYCITFNKIRDGKIILFLEEPFSLTECKKLFGSSFNY